ncbi:hypothetical protein D3C75_1185670 [compost metagenome]
MQHQPAAFAVIDQIGHDDKTDAPGNNQEHDDDIDYRIAGISGQAAEVPKDIKPGIIEHRHGMKDAEIQSAAKIHIRRPAQRQQNRTASFNNQ